MHINIIIGGDLVPTKSNEQLFINSDMNELIGDALIEIIKNSNMNIFNLEVPLTNELLPIGKCGPNLIAKTETVKGIKALKPNLLCLANNHILDQGDNGLRSTIKTLEENHIEYIGAGENIDSAKRIFIKDINGLKIGVYNCTEHEFSIAENNKSGANPFDVIESYKHVKELRYVCDYLIVIYHGGIEHYRYPSPNLQKYCRYFVECGADLVVCQHSHCIGCEERYHSATIVYGQGNFIFDNSISKKNEFWQTSILVSISILERNNVEINYIPLIKNNEKVRIAEEKIKDNILRDFIKRSEEIKQKNFIKNKYIELSEKYISNYLFSVNNMIIPEIKYFSSLRRKVFRHFFYRLIHKKNLYRILNYLDCEAHNELFKTGIKRQLEYFTLNTN